MANPITEINIINVPFNYTQQNVFSFDSLAQQTAYFKGMATKSYPNNYVVKDNVIQVAERFEDVKGNYISYKNKNKWYYGFIDRIKYINEGLTEIEYTIDAWQTFYFEFTVQKSFVEREHVTNDSIGSNLIPEPFNYNKRAISSGIATENYMHHLLAVTFTADASQENMSEAERNDVRAGIITRVVGHNKGRATGGITKVYTINQMGLSALLRDVNKLSDKGASSITSMFEVPSYLLVATYDENMNGGGKDGIDITSLPNRGFTNTADSLTQLQSKIGYTVRNKKLLSDQFFHWELLNNSGGTLETYPSETNYQAPKYDTVVNTGQNIFAVARVDNLLVGSETVHLTTAQVDSVSWSGSAYGEYLAQNKNSIDNKTLQNFAGLVSGIGGSVVTGNPLGVVGSLVGGIAEVMNVQAREKDMQNQSVGTRGSQNSSGLANIYANKLVWWAYGLTKNDLERADLFLDRYGYQVNMFKVPNHNSRTHFNYIKTAECNITGAIPKEYMQQLINMYNSGFTIWHGQSFATSRTINDGEEVKLISYEHFMKYDTNEIKEGD